MRKFSSPYGKVILTDERLKHILVYHPDVKACVQHFATATKNPDQVARSAKDPDTMIHYRYLSRRKKYLAVVVQTKKKFIITAYLAKKPKRDTL